MKELELIDRVSDFGAPSTREYTSNGFLKVKGRVARSGIQKYYGCELGLKDSPYKLFSIYRPADVVLSDSVCKMFKGADVTNDHPKNFVSPDNYRALSSGVIVSDAYKDEKNPSFICCDMLIKDKATIKAIEAGKVALSVGYRNTLDFTPGTTPEGEAYDAKVDAITLVNHVAIVNRARAGMEARVLDSVGGNMKTIKIGAHEVELNDSVADAVSEHIEKLEKDVSDKDAELGKLSAKITDLEAELEEAKSLVLTDEDMKEIFAEAEKAKSEARIIAGDKFVCDSFDPIEIKRAAIAVANPDLDMKDKSEGFIEGYFAHAVASKKVDAGMNDSQSKVSEALKAKDEKPKEDPYKKAKEDIANRWKCKK